jgi:DNA-binding MarR family transcriptional regulator
MRDSNASTPDELKHRGDEPHLLREIVRTHQVLISGLSRKLGMTSSRFVLMRLIAVAEDDVGVMDLARHLGVNAAAVTRQVRELEREHLVRRRADHKDGRRSYVSLTPKGQQLFAEIHERSHELERTLSEVLGAREMANAATTLMKLRTFVEDLR